MGRFSVAENKNEHVWNGWDFFCCKQTHADWEIVKKEERKKTHAAESESDLRDCYDLRSLWDLMWDT